MTVTYTQEVANAKGFGCFWRLLFRWRGSVYKLVWLELIIFSILYYSISAVYRLALTEGQKRTFEKVSLYCQHFSDFIPVSFVLGFYVTLVIKRWWDQYQLLPWPDSLCLLVSTFISGMDERGRLMRRTIVRYANLTFAMTLSMNSVRIKKRFPTLEHLVEAGFMNPNEKAIFDDVKRRCPQQPSYWMPLVWAGTIVSRARKEGRIRDDFAVKTIMDEINRLRSLCGSLLGYDRHSIPLVYTQVVTLSVYTFFLSTLMSRQFLDPQQDYANRVVDMYVPIFTFLQFFFYMGWLKVAESLVNPFGEDDDDFELNWLVDRNLQISYLIVDGMHNEHPEMIQDIYWDKVFPEELPYTVAAQEYRRGPQLGSTANLVVPVGQQIFLPTLEEEAKLMERDDEVTSNEEEAGNFKIHIGSVPVSIRRDSVDSGSYPRKSSVLSFIQNRLVPGGHSPPNKKRSRFGVRTGSKSSMQWSSSRKLLSRSISRQSQRSESFNLKQQDSESDDYLTPEVEGTSPQVFFFQRQAERLREASVRSKRPPAKDLSPRAHRLSPLDVEEEEEEATEPLIEPEDPQEVASAPEDPQEVASAPEDPQKVSQSTQTSKGKSQDAAVEVPAVRASLDSYSSALGKDSSSLESDIFPMEPQ